jgi:hypothetical protein
MKKEQFYPIFNNLTATVSPFVVVTTVSIIDIQQTSKPLGNDEYTSSSFRRRCSNSVTSTCSHNNTFLYCISHNDEKKNNNRGEIRNALISS